VPILSCCKPSSWHARPPGMASSATGTSMVHWRAALSDQVVHLIEFDDGKGTMDKDGNPLRRANRHRLTFASDTFPSLNRYVLRPDSRELTYGTDGSLTRKEAIRTGDWFPPGIERVG
jgi:hypothetical protein